MFVRGLISQFKIRNMPTTTKAKNPSAGKVDQPASTASAAKTEFTQETYLFWYENMQLMRKF